MSSSVAAKRDDVLTIRDATRGLQLDIRYWATAHCNGKDGLANQPGLGTRREAWCKGGTNDDAKGSGKTHPIGMVSRDVEWNNIRNYLRTRLAPSRRSAKDPSLTDANAKAWRSLRDARAVSCGARLGRCASTHPVDSIAPQSVGLVLQRSVPSPGGVFARPASSLEPCCCLLGL